MEHDFHDPFLPFAYPVGSVFFAKQLSHINCKISGRSLLKMDDYRESISIMAKSPSSDTGLLLEKIRSYFVLWRTFSIFAENNRSIVKSIGPISFCWYVPSLDVEYKSPIIRFETICLCSLYASVSFNTGCKTESSKLAKEYFLTAHRICEGIWRHELLSWTLREEKNLPLESTISGCSITKMFCLLALQRRAVNVICKKIEESTYEPGIVPKIFIANVRLCLWWYIASDRLAKTLASRKMDYPKLSVEQLEIARLHRESSFLLLFYFSALIKEKEAKYDECIVFATTISRFSSSNNDTLKPCMHSKEWIFSAAARMVGNNNSIWLADKSEKSSWELLPCKNGIFFLEEQEESVKSIKEEFREKEMQMSMDFLFIK